MTFGQRLREARVAQNLACAQLGDRAGVSANYIGSIENDNRDPSLSVMAKLAAGLGVPLGDLLGGVRELSPRAVEMGRMFSEVPEGVQSGVLDILRSVER